MSDLNALAQKLAALGATDDLYADGARVISQGGTPSPLAAVLRAVDETVLDRILVFAAGETTVSIIASGRRLRGLSEVTPAYDAATSLIGETISREDPSTLDNSFALLSDLLDAADPLTVRSMPATRFGSGGERGVPAADLAKLWQIDLNAAPMPPLAQFLDANDSIITALLHVSAGDIMASKGENAVLEQIWETQVQAYIDAQAKLAGPDNRPHLVCLDGALGDGATAALAFAGQDVALLTFETAHLGRLHTSWQAAFR